MPRGAIVPTTAGDAVARALRWIDGRPLPTHPQAPADAKPSPIRYRLKGGYNGGKDPLARHPASWSYGLRVPTADCVGFVAWCLGFDRLQPGHFPTREGYANCDSICDDADAERSFFARVVGAPRPGDVVAYRSRYVLGVRVAVGHIGLVVSDPVTADPWSCRVVDCSASVDRKRGHAISMRPDASVWRKRGVFLRYVRQAP
jgi:hypothetical protein